MRYLGLAVFLACGFLTFAQDDSYQKMEPTGTPHKVTMSVSLREKVELAYLAVRDVEDLADPDVFLPENLDAKRAIREARAVAQDKESNDVLDDIEMLRSLKETCRVENTSAGFHRCLDVEVHWMDRIRTEIGPTRPPTGK